MWRSRLLQRGGPELSPVVLGREVGGTLLGLCCTLPERISLQGPLAALFEEEQGTQQRQQQVHPSCMRREPVTLHAT